jgi:Tol biopolymer transport system component
VLVANGARWPSVSSDGTIVMLSGSASTSVRPTWIDEAGKVGAAISRMRAVRPRISPDGRFVAATVGFEADADIWIFDLVQGTERRLTFEPGGDVLPTWSPDGKFIVYGCADADAVCARPADGSGARVELLAESTRGASISPDGRRLLFDRNKGAASGLFVVDLGPAGVSVPLTATPRPLAISARIQSSFDISPDSRFVAYTSREGGTDAVFVTQFPDGGGKWEIPVRMATDPRWSAKGDRLFVLDELSRVVEVPVDLKGTFTAGKPQVRFAAPGVQRGLGFDVSRDARSFLFPLPPSATDSHTTMLVVRNWKPAKQ